MGSIVKTLADLGVAAGAITAIGVLLVALSRLPPIRWINRRMIVDPISNAFGAWVQRQVLDATAEHWHLTRYHLGSNDTTMPFYRRLERLEVAANIEPAEQHPDVER